METAIQSPDRNIQARLEELHQVAPDSIGDRMHFRLVEWNDQGSFYRFVCSTEPWMRNAAGTLHGGMCATVLDQAMGFVAYCVKPGPGLAPTIQMQVNYHRPLIPGQEVSVSVRVVSKTRHLMSLTAEAAQASAPEKLCLSASGTYYYRESADETAPPQTI